MPRFNALGQIAELRRAWFDLTRQIFQDCSSGECGIYLSDGTPIAPGRAAGAVVGAAGKWAAGAWIEKPSPGVTPYKGVFAWNGDFTGAAISAEGAGPNGEYALKLAYFSYGPWDVVEPDGSRWRLTDGDAGVIQLLGNRRAIWMESLDGWLHSNFGVPQLPERAWGFRATDANGRVVVLYQSRDTGRLILDGRVIAPTGDYYYFDVAFVDGRYLVTWSPNQADTDAQLLKITPAELATYPRVSDPAPSVPPVPPPVIVQPKEPTVTAPEPLPAFVDFVMRRWTESGAAELTARDFDRFDEAHWKYFHASVLFRILGEAYHVHGYEFGVYPKDSGTRYIQDGQGYGEDIILLKDAAGRVFWKDVGVGFGGPTPRIEFGAFSLSQPEDQGKYLPPPKPSGVVVPPVPPTPGPTPPVDQTAKFPALQPIVNALVAQAAALRAIEKPAAEQVRVEVPVPCSRPHVDDQPTWPDYASTLVMIKACQEAYGRRILPADDFGAHLVWRFLREGYTFEQLVDEARERGQQ